MKLLGTGFHWDELRVGDQYRTYGRTITDADIVNFINCVGMVEVLFTDAEFRRHESAIQGRVAPGALVFSIAEALTLTATAQGTGLAFLGTDLEIHKPVVADDTIHVEIEVTEIRPTSKGNRGIVRTRNRIVNQHGETVITYSPKRMMKGRSS
jgi:acyl dehydratase